LSRVNALLPTEAAFNLPLHLIPLIEKSQLLFRQSEGLFNPAIGNLINLWKFQFSVFQIALLGAFFGAIGQLGDLSESLIKRDCHVKDSGKLLPGIGGVMDIIDSLLFSAPAFYLYMSATLRTS